ncbi:MAG: DUF4340 domain-containing protein [Oscillospiraceae bacterium]|nr:DUF4340 domain-containing protein [Oscillospiraceae bacterium]
MKKKQRNLLLLLGVLVLLGGAIYLLTTVTEDPAEQSDVFTPVSHARNEVAQITVANSSGSYTIVKDETSDAGYYCAEIDGLPQLLSLYTALVDDCREINASFRYEKVDLARYGLTDPRAQATVTLEDGSSYTVSVGDRAPSENYCYYTVSTEPDVVYATRESQFTTCLDDVYGLVNRLLAPHTGGNRSSNDETDVADWFEFTVTDGTRYRIERVKGGYVDGADIYYHYKQTMPLEGNVLGTRVQEVFSRLMQFSASSAVIYHPTEEQIAQCGLDKPFTELVIGYKEEAATIRFARMENSTNYYAYKEGIDAIWVVADYMITWMDLQPRSMISTYVAAPAADEVAKLDITAYGKSWSFVPANGSAIYEGSALDGAQFSKLYELACSVNSQSPLDVKSGETVVKIRFTLHDGSVRTVELYSAAQRSLGIRLDGEVLGLSIRESYAETLAAACEAVVNGQNVSTAW